MKSAAAGTMLLLVCSSALWDTATSEVQECGSVLEISSVGASSSSKGNGDINRRSLSPWSWRSTRVADRIPEVIWEAECSSTSCFPPTSGQSGTLDLNSVPIYQNVLVLNRPGGSGCFTASLQSVSVGCTCVKAQSIQV